MYSSKSVGNTGNGTAEPVGQVDDGGGLDGTVVYEGALAGLVGVDGSWVFEGRSYDTPATEGDVLGTVGAALSEPSDELVAGAKKLVFGSGTDHLALVLTALARAYEAEVSDGDGCDPVVTILADAARRIAVIEALTV